MEREIEMNAKDLARECNRRLDVIDAALSHLKSGRPISAYENLKDARNSMERITEEQTLNET